MQSKATTVEAYLASLPPDRRQAIDAVRKVILANLDKDYEEGMSYGMIGYYIPHSVYPPGYHCDPSKPLPMGGLASQKQYLSVYLMTTYADGTGQEQWFRKAWAKTGKKLDMGKCCIRFKRVEDLALDVIGEAIRRVPAKAYIKHYEATLAASRAAAPARTKTKRATPAPKFKVPEPKRAGTRPARPARTPASKGRHR